MILFDLDQTNIGLSICVRFWGSKLCSSCQSSLRRVGEQNIEQSRGNLTSWELRTLPEQLNCKFLIFSKHKVLAVYCIHDLVIQNQLCLEYLTPNREKMWLTAINHLKLSENLLFLCILTWCECWVQLLTKQLLVCIFLLNIDTKQENILECWI